MNITTIIRNHIYEEARCRENREEIKNSLSNEKIDTEWKLFIDRLEKKSEEALSAPKTINLSKKYVYRINTIDMNWVSSYFQKNSYLSRDGEDIYTRRFPVYRWEMSITIEAEIRVNLTGKRITVECFDAGTNNPYAAYYYVHCGDYEKLLKSIDEKIKRELNKIGVIKYICKKDNPN